MYGARPRLSLGERSTASASRDRQQLAKCACPSRSATSRYQAVIEHTGIVLYGVSGPTPGLAERGMGRSACQLIRDALTADLRSHPGNSNALPPGSVVPVNMLRLLTLNGGHEITTIHAASGKVHEIVAAMTRRVTEPASRLTPCIAT